MGFDDPEEPQWDTWKLDPAGTEWNQVALSSTSIEARGGFASCLLGDSAVVSGGYGHFSGDLIEQKALETGGGGTSDWKNLIDVEDRYPARSGATLTAVDPHTGYLFGGFADGFASNELYQLTYEPSAPSDALRWKKIDTGREMPPGRSAHAAVSLQEGADGLKEVRSSFYVFGGFGPEGALNDLWVYQEEKWRRLDPSGDAPSPRSGHSMVACDEGKFLLCGGVGGSGECYSDIHVYDARTNRWEAIECGDVPVPRYNHRAVVTDGALVVTGGCTDEDGMGMGVATGECYAIDLSQLL
jgi:hypothetical protein